MIFDKKTEIFSLSKLLNYDAKENALFGTVDKSTSEQNTYSKTETNSDNHSIKYAYTGGNVSQVYIIGSAGASGVASPSTLATQSDYITPTATTTQSATQQKSSEAQDNTLLILGGLAVAGFIASEVFKTQRSNVKEAGGALKGITG